MMPLDPFADDPNDPASFLEDDEHVAPLTTEERNQVTQDLEIVRDCKKYLSPRGMRGIFFFCEDCEIAHYYDWDMMATNMIATLQNQVTPVHEPSASPEINAYVTWDYALGYLDGLQGR